MQEAQEAQHASYDVVSSRDADIAALQQHLEEAEAHYQTELDDAHAHLLATQEVHSKLEQQLRDSEAKRYCNSFYSFLQLVHNLHEEVFVIKPPILIAPAEEES